MKSLKPEQEYIYDDFKALQCGACQKKLWDKGTEINRVARIRCPRCGTLYSFEATRWRVLAEAPE